MGLHFPPPAEASATRHPDDQAILEDWISQFTVPNADERISLFDLRRAFPSDTGCNVTAKQMRGRLEA